MKSDSFANRLQKALDISNKKQIDLANKTKIDKSLINKYLKGISEPGNDNISIIAKALNVNEVWLMGYDVPITSQDDNTNDDLINKYKILFDKDDKLTDIQKEFIMNTITEQHKKFDEEQEKNID